MGALKRGRGHNREPEWEVSRTWSRKVEEARKDWQKEKRNWRVGGKKNTWERRALNYSTYAWTHEINILKISSASLKRKQWLDQVAGPHRWGSQVTHGGRQPLKRLLPYCPWIIHSRWMWAWARPSDSFLTEKTREKLMGCHFQDSVTKNALASMLLTLSCFLSLAHSKECQLLYCELHFERNYMTRNWGRSLANSHGGNGAWQPTREEHPRSWTLNYLSKLEENPPSAELTNETAPVGNADYDSVQVSEIEAPQALVFSHTNYGTMKICNSNCWISESFPQTTGDE